MLLVDASTLGSPVKINDKLRTIFTTDDEEKIVAAILGREEVPEFSTIVEYSALKERVYLLKPGLYFKLDYAKLSLEHTKKEDDFAVARQRILGVLNTLRLETTKTS